MTIRIVPYTAEHEEAVRAFNARSGRDKPRSQPVFDAVSCVARSDVVAQAARMRFVSGVFVAVDDESAVRAATF